MRPTQLLELPDRRAAALEQCRRWSRGGSYARCPGRPCRVCRSGLRAQLGHLRRGRGRQRHVRDRALGTGRALQPRARGVNGVNVHVREDAINGAFALRDRGLIARPLLYGMILFDRTLGPGACSSLHGCSPDGPWTSRRGGEVDGGVLHVLLIDKTNRSGTVQLRLPATATATVQRLLARSADAVRHHARRPAARQRCPVARPTVEQTIAPDATGYRLAMAGWSAALVSVKLPSGRPA